MISDPENNSTTEIQTVFITGATGLIGSHLLKVLTRQGKKVRALYRTQKAFEHPCVEWVRGDINDILLLEEATQDAQHVYHCAALVSFNPKQKRELLKTNVDGTANVVNAALQAGIKKLVHVSSVAALGRIRENETVNEEMNWTADTSNSNYAQSKYLSELEVWRGTGEGLNAVMVNPVIILGAGDWNNSSSQIFKNVYKEFPWYSEGTTGFVDVRDVAAAMIQLMEADINAQRFILSAGNRSYHELFNLIAGAFGKKPPHKKVTPFIAKVVWCLEALKSKFTGHDPLVTKETARTAMAKVNFDNSKLTKYLPQFSYRKIEDTVGFTCALFQQKLNRQ